MNIVTRLFCKHPAKSFVRNIYGDEINYANARSYWRCDECGKLIASSALNQDVELTTDQMGRDVLEYRRGLSSQPDSQEKE